MRDPFEVVVLLAAGFFYVLSAGGYAFFYAYGKLRGEEKFRYLALLFAGVTVYSAYLMVASPVFDAFWKGFLSVATVAYLLVPKGMWWVVVRVHRAEEEERKRAKTF